MPFCHQCGITLEPGDRFCPGCGTAVRGTAGTPAEPVSAGPAASRPAPNLEFQGVGIRFVAQLIDGVLLLVFYFVAGYYVAGRVGGLTPDGFELKGAPALLVMGLSLLAWLAYLTLLEAFWRGQSLGKKLTGIRVARANGDPIGFTEALVRNVLRVVDGLIFYLVGAILVWRSPRKQRLGDRVAGTVVIKKNGGAAARAA